MVEPVHVLVSAGDPSGDRHAAALVRDLKAQRESVSVSALGGSHLKDCAEHFIFDLVSLGGFGFWEPLLQLPSLLKARGAALRVMKQNRPNIVILVDFYGFNIHLARAAKSLDIPVLYYISPQVWASRPHRIEELRKTVHRMMVLFPFEVPIYEKAGVLVTRVRHPLLDNLPEPSPLSTGPISIGFLPGSRRQVLKRHLPLIENTLLILQRRFPSARFTLIRPKEINPEPFEALQSRCPGLAVESDDNYQIRRHLTVALSVSGTAALELTLLGIPMILFYRLSAITFALAKQIVKIPYIGIPNILAGKAIVPEFLQTKCTPVALAAAAADIIENHGKQRDLRRSLLQLREGLLQNAPAPAEVVLSELSLRSTEI